MVALNATAGTASPEMQRWLAQPVLFAGKVSRRALLGLPAAPAAALHVGINVWRNHAFEPLLPLLAPYFGYGRWQADFHLGGYDDSLGFHGAQPADVELLWLDRSRLRLGAAAFVAWLHERLQALRALSTAAIVLCTWCDDAEEAAALQVVADSLPGVYFADLGAAARAEAVPLLDGRSAALAGTPLSSAAQVVLARRLACHWLPAVALPPIKALALDLDHTLHQGVLGEDGVQGVVLTPAHAELQRYARSLRERGIFLALVSRNEPADVQRLFAERNDYPLKWADFSATEVSWGDKAEALQRIAAQLRIAPDAVLFVDDNAGELARVQARLPQLPTVHADADAGLTQRTLQHHPGLWRWKAGADDARRIADLASNAEREQLAATLPSPDEVLRHLQVSLSLAWDSSEQLQRAAELCRKTNQFNLALRRHGEAELAERMASPQASVATVKLSDRLADSGTVAVIVARREGQTLRVEDICISCRAMGRGLEDAIVLLALRGMAAFEGCTQLAFEVQETDRNGPARQWLAGLLGSAALPAAGRHVVSAERIKTYAAPAAITILEKHHATA